MKSLIIDNKEFVITGRFVRILRLKEEWDADIENPEEIISKFRRLNVKADLFTFAQRLPHIEPLFKYSMEWDNVAAIPLSTYEHWWTKQVYQQVRNHVRKSIKSGVVIKESPFNDDLIRGITDIFNETPIRQGTSNTHFGKTFAETKALMGTYLERSTFLGAYWQEELIGFIKIVFTGNFARTMGIEAKIKHRDKRPMNALISKAVEICVNKGVKYFVYGKFIYGKKGADSLTKFKQYNGFQQINLPRYYVPLNLKGKIILLLHLHKRINELLPRFVVKFIIKIRKYYYETKYWKELKNFRKKQNNRET